MVLFKNVFQKRSFCVFIVSLTITYCSSYHYHCFVSSLKIVSDQLFGRPFDSFHSLKKKLLGSEALLTEFKVTSDLVEVVLSERKMYFTTFTYEWLELIRKLIKNDELKLEVLEACEEVDVFAIQMNVVL